MFRSDVITVKIVQHTIDAPRIIAVASKTSLSRKPLDRLIDISNEEVDVWIRETELVENKAIQKCLLVGLKA